MDVNQEVPKGNLNRKGQLKPVIYWFVLLLLALWAPACGEAETDGPITVQGPALVMFYTNG